MIEEVSRQMFRQFSTCVRQQLEAVDQAQATESVAPSAGETKAVSAAPLAFHALWAIIVRFFKRLFGRQSP
jgi:hypothetical protein